MDPTASVGLSNICIICITTIDDFISSRSQKRFDLKRSQYSNTLEMIESFLFSHSILIVVHWNDHLNQVHIKRAFAHIHTCAYNKRKAGLFSHRER